MTKFYRFPAMAKLGEFTNQEQAHYIQDESDEAYSALVFWTYGNGSHDHEADRMAYGMELLDVIHATETALRMEFADEEVEELQRRVIEKNQTRGYYDE